MRFAFPSLLALCASALVGCGLFGGGTTPTPTPAPSAPNSAVTEPAGSSQLVQRATGAWATQTFAPGNPIAWRHGIFFTDNITGASKGFSITAVPQMSPDTPPTPTADGISQEAIVAQYNVGGEGRWIWTVVWHGSESDGFLLNRETVDGWSWNANELGLEALSADYLLFERAVGPDPHQHSTGKYVVTDANLQVISTFELPASWFAPTPYVSNRGTAAIWVTERSEQTRILKYTLYLVDLRSGSSREIYSLPVDLVGRDFQQSVVVESDISEEGISVGIVRPEASGESLARIPSATDEIRFDWEGKRVGERRNPGGILSPDGQYMVYETFTRFETGGGGEGGGDRWPVVTLSRADGIEVFRILSSSISFGDGMPGRRWLADGSGFVVLIDNSAEQPGWPADNIGYAIIRLDGSVERLPELPAMPEPNRWFESEFNRGPEPHPADPNLLAFGHFELLDLARGTWRGSPYVADNQGPMHIGPWIEGEADRVFAIPHGGHGGWGPAVLLQPLVQRAPFSGEPSMVVAPGECLNLRESASLDAAVLDCLQPGTELRLADPPAGLEPGTAEYFEARVVRISESGTWLKVMHGGWVNAAFVRWAD